MVAAEAGGAAETDPVLTEAIESMRSCLSSETYADVFAVLEKYKVTRTDDCTSRSAIDSPVPAGPTRMAHHRFP